MAARGAVTTIGRSDARECRWDRRRQSRRRSVLAATGRIAPKRSATWREARMRPLSAAEIGDAEVSTGAPQIFGCEVLCPYFQARSRSLPLKLAGAAMLVQCYLVIQVSRVGDRGYAMQMSDRIGRRMKLHDLHVFMAVVQAGSMNKAARLLNTGQSA